MIGTEENKKWFAIYVKSRCEKKVIEELEKEGIESFLPMITKIKQWSDRKKKVEEPLFKSYVFVFIDLKNEKEKVLHSNGVVCFISFEGKPTSIPENQIIAIKQYISDSSLQDLEYDINDLKEGEMVIIKSGQMRGLTGRFVELKGKHRLIIEIEVIGQSIPINIAKSKVEKLQSTTGISL